MSRHSPIKAKRRPARRTVRGSVLLAVCSLAAAVGAGEAQQADSSSTRSTALGVYTRAQAVRGRDLYAGMCTSCHTPASHTGPAFTSAWAGAAVWELFEYVSENMPKDDPGHLSAAEYVQVIAYLLEMNGVPAGDDELPADSVALSNIRIEWSNRNRTRRP